MLRSCSEIDLCFHVCCYGEISLVLCSRLSRRCGFWSRNHGRNKTIFEFMISHLPLHTRVIQQGLAHTHTHTLDVVSGSNSAPLDKVHTLCVSFECVCTRKSVLNYLQSSWTQRVERKARWGFPQSPRVSLPIYSRGRVTQHGRCFHSASSQHNLYLDRPTTHDDSLFLTCAVSFFFFPQSLSSLQHAKSKPWLFA